VKAFRLLLYWQFLRLRKQIVMIAVIQVLLALGIIYGLAFLFPHIDSRSALFLATGAPTITLLVLGMTVVPQEVSQARLTGQAAYMATLPVPRLAPPAAEVTFWLLVQLPGTAHALVLAAMRFHFALHINPAVAPAIAFVALTGAAVGYALASTLKPQSAQQLASFISIGILLFSPINFPIERLPVVLRAIHRALPVKYMADVVRWSLTGRYAPQIGLAFAIVAAWCAVGIALSWRVAVRRA
jgi:ABC-2 type transport system permease protein